MNIHVNKYTGGADSVHCRMSFFIEVEPPQSQ